MLSGLVALAVDKLTKKVFNELVKDPFVQVSRADEIVVKPAIEQAAREEIAPIIEHLTNNEPWYRSNVTWGAIFSITGGITTIGTLWVNGVPLSFEAYGTPAMAVWGGGQALFGRWIARRPIGA